MNFSQEAKKRKAEESEISEDWILDEKLTNNIISFIPFCERSAVFLSSKMLNQICFDDFWSTGLSIYDYLNHLSSLAYNIMGVKGGDKNIEQVFRAGNVNEIKLVCRYERFKFITDYLKFVPSKSIMEVLNRSLRQMGINPLIFETVAFDCCLAGFDEAFDLLVYHGLYDVFWFNRLVLGDDGLIEMSLLLLANAANSNNIHIVTNLIDNGEIIFFNEDLSKALSSACTKFKSADVEFNWPPRNNENIDGLAVVKLLIERGANLSNSSEYCPPLLAAFEKGNLEIINYLLEMGADPMARFDENDILNMACYSLDVKVVERALGFGFDLSKGYEYLTKLLNKFDKTREKDVAKICETLIKAGARVDLDDLETVELLVCSCKSEMLEVIKLFAANRADYNLYNDPDYDLSDDEILYDTLSPLYAAISTENLEIVKFLVQKLQVRIEFDELFEIDENWINPVVYAFETVKSKEITRFLLNAGFSARPEDIERIKTFLNSTEEDLNTQIH